jgi:hypothetical protein
MPLLLRSLPFPDPGRLVRIYFNNPGVGLRGVRFSAPEFDDLRTQTDVFEDVSVVVLGPTNLTGAKLPEHLEMIEVSPNYFFHARRHARTSTLVWSPGLRARFRE